jgi:hypothetical protein
MLLPGRPLKEVVIIYMLHEPIESSFGRRTGRAVGGYLCPM